MKNNAGALVNDLLARIDRVYASTSITKDEYEKLTRQLKVKSVDEKVLAELSKFLDGIEKRIAKNPEELMLDANRATFMHGVDWVRIREKFQTNKELGNVSNEAVRESSVKKCISAYARQTKQAVRDSLNPLLKMDSVNIMVTKGGRMSSARIGSSVANVDMNVKKYGSPKEFLEELIISQPYSQTFNYLFGLASSAKNAPWKPEELRRDLCEVIEKMSNEGAIKCVGGNGGLIHFKPVSGDKSAPSSGQRPAGGNRSGR